MGGRELFFTQCIINLSNSLAQDAVMVTNLNGNKEGPDELMEDRST